MPEQQNGRRNHNHYHHYNNGAPQQQPRIVPLAPTNNGKNWLIVLFAAIAVLATIAYFSSNKSQSAAPPVNVKEVKPTSITVKDTAPTVKEDVPAKSSGNTGKSNNNGNVEIRGNKNNVHVGNNNINVTKYERHYHYHEKGKTTTVIKEVKRTTRRLSKECEDLRIKHEATVAAWKAAME